MAFTKGKPRPKGAGRKKGVPNKITRDIREAWEDAIAHVQGVEGATLRDWAEANPDKFWPLTMQMVPKKTELSGNLTLEHLLGESHKDGE